MDDLSSSDRRLMEHAAGAPMLEQVQRWTAVNSGSRNLPGLASMAGMLADAFSALPGEIKLLEPAPVDAVAPDGQREPIEHGRHLYLVVRPCAPVQLLLTGHMDTVFSSDHPFQHSRWTVEGMLNGPGVADMKGGLAVMLAALKALETCPESRTLGYELIINSDEELGSPSSASLIQRAAQGKLAALTYEPSLPDGTLAGARSGSGNFSFIIAGRSAHAGRNPEEGRNAILAAADLALRLNAANDEGFSCNPARIDGGSPNNVVPDHAVLRVNFRPRLPQDQQRIAKLIDREVAATSSSHQVAIHVHGGFNRPPKPMDPRTENLFDLVRQCGADLGLTLNWRDTGGVCDGNNIAACGVPVVDTMGVRGGDIHSDSEYLITDSLAERAQLSALTLLRLAREQWTGGRST